MPYKVVQRGEEYCVVKADDPDGKSFGCHPTAAEAGKQIGAIEANEKAKKIPTKAWVAKAGQFISSKLLRGKDGRYEVARVKASISVFKDASGKYRWVLLSSNSLEDRDGEVVSQKALEKDVERADKSQDYGPLRWWHVPGLDLGVCDFNAMHGRVLVESGTFYHEEVGKAVKAKADQLGASLGFYHPISEPDAEGVYYNIRRYERSLLPRDEAANPYTMLLVEQEKATMQKIKEDQLRSMLDSVNPDLVETILSSAADVEVKALEAGVRHKEADPPATDPVPIEPVADPAPASPAPAPAPAIEPAIEPASEPASEPVADPAAEPEKPVEETAKEISKSDQVNKVSQAVTAMNPSYGGGPFVYADTVFDDYVIVCGEKTYKVPYTQTPEGDVTLAPMTDWTEVQREWVPISKEAAPVEQPDPATLVKATRIVAEKAMSLLIKEDRPEEEEKPAVAVPPVAEVAAPPVPPAEEEEKAPPPPPPPPAEEEEKPAAAPAAPPAEEAAPTGELNENTPVGDLTLGQLGSIVGSLMAEAMAPLQGMDKKIAALEGVVGGKTKELGTTVAGLNASVSKFQKALDVLIGEAPRAKARDARAALAEETLLTNQPEEVQQLKDQKPGPDEHLTSGLDKIMGAIAASGNVAPPLVLGGGPPK